MNEVSCEYPYVLLVNSDIGFNEWTYKQFYSFSCLFFSLSTFEEFSNLLKSCKNSMVNTIYPSSSSCQLPATFVFFSLPLSPHTSPQTPLSLQHLKISFSTVFWECGYSLTWPQKLYSTWGDSQIYTLLLWRARIAELCRWYSLCGNSSRSLNKRVWTT